MEGFRVQDEPGPHRKTLHQKTTVATLNMGILVLFKTEFFFHYFKQICVCTCNTACIERSRDKLDGVGSLHLLGGIQRSNLSHQT